MSDNESKLDIIPFKTGDDLIIQDIGMNNFHGNIMNCDGIQIKNQYAKFSNIIPLDILRECLDKIGYKIIKKHIVNKKNKKSTKKK